MADPEPVFHKNHVCAKNFCKEAVCWIS